MIAKFPPRVVTLNSSTPVNLRNANASSPSACSIYFTGGSVRVGKQNMTYAAGGGFPLMPDVINNFPAQGDLWAMCAAGTLDVEILDFEQ